MSELNVGLLNASEGVQIPYVISANRPTTPSTGSIIFNTTTQSLEKWSGSSWVSISGPKIVATGGNISYYLDFKIHTFLGNGTFSVTTAAPNSQIEYLIVAGGGGGGSAGDIQAGGGGGAGGFLEGFSNITIGTYPIVVGAGGLRGDSSTSWDGYDGSNSSAFGLTAIGGGGGGGRQDRSGRSGGSGGGRASGGGGGQGGSGTPGQGNRGGNGNNHLGSPQNVSPFNASGGGGAGEQGYDSTLEDIPGNGGFGKISYITGTGQYYAGGGAAGQRNAATGYGIGGLGGGGNGGHVPGGFAATAGLQYTGGGGGGGQNNAGGANGANGGSGIVIIRYRIF
jgi:hypothetical protein